MKIDSVGNYFQFIFIKMLHKNTEDGNIENHLKNWNV